MKKYTNKHKIPESIVFAIQQQDSDYDNAGSFVSASSISKPVRIFWLERRHSKDAVEDISDKIWSLLGSSVHLILERADQQRKELNPDLEVRFEERLFTEVLGRKVSGQFDRLELNKKVLQDYKITSVWSVKGEAKAEWEAQLNVLRYLLHLNGTEVKKLQVVAILRDWSKAKSKYDSDYPKSQIKVINIPVWSYKKTKAYLEERVALYIEHENTPDDELPECTLEDRWQDPIKWAIMCDGKKRATKLHDNELDAIVHKRNLEAKGIKVKIEERSSEPRRCVDYCSVNFKCNQYKKLVDN